MFAQLRAHANMFIKIIENSKFGVTNRNKVSTYFYCITEKLIIKPLKNDLLMIFVVVHRNQPILPIQLKHQPAALVYTICDSLKAHSSGQTRTLILHQKKTVTIKNPYVIYSKTSNLLITVEASLRLHSRNRSTTN